MNVKIKNLHASLAEYMTKVPSILHIDFHCDQRGCVITPSYKGIIPINLTSPADDGNFIAHTLLKHKKDFFIWVYPNDYFSYNDGGGKTLLFPDNFKGVKWAFVYLKLHLTKPQTKFYYSIVPSTKVYAYTWPHVHTVSLDWDYVTSKNYPSTQNWMPRLREVLYLLKSTSPKQILFARSPEYCHNSRGQIKLRNQFEQHLLTNFRPSAIITDNSIRKGGAYKMARATGGGTAARPGGIRGLAGRAVGAVRGLFGR